jgi:hypothetical protein
MASYGMMFRTVFKKIHGILALWIMMLGHLWAEDMPHLWKAYSSFRWKYASRDDVKSKEKACEFCDCAGRSDVECNFCHCGMFPDFELESNRFMHDNIKKTIRPPYRRLQYVPYKEKDEERYENDDEGEAEDQYDDEDEDEDKYENDGEDSSSSADVFVVMNHPIADRINRLEKTLEKFKDKYMNPKRPVLRTVDCGTMAQELESIVNEYNKIARDIVKLIGEGSAASLYPPIDAKQKKYFLNEPFYLFLKNISRKVKETRPLIEEVLVKNHVR